MSLRLLLIADFRYVIMRMPGMDGLLDLASHLRRHAQGAQLPLVMLSSLDHSAVQAKALNFGR